MPIVHFHLIEGAATPAQEAELLCRASAFYADTLQSPIERVRAFIHSFPAARCAVGGKLVSEGAPVAPYFEFIVLEGRPLTQRHALLIGFTDLIAEVLGAERALIRGRCKQVSAEEWCIGGRIAAEARAEHIVALSVYAGSGV